jgi:microcompartment protein CcmL/EutN
VNGALAFLETTGLTPAMVAIDTMAKTAAVRILQVELNDLYGVCVKVTGPIADLSVALATGRDVADRMNGRPVATLLTQVEAAARPGIWSQPEFNPLIQQQVVFMGDDNPTQSTVSDPLPASLSTPMNGAHPVALGFIETQGFTAVFEAIDTACKTANVEVLGKEKLGGGYVTVVVQGELSAVTAAITAGQAKVDGLGKLIAAHVIARPSPAVLSLLPKV